MVHRLRPAEIRRSWFPGGEDATRSVGWRYRGYAAGVSALGLVVLGVVAAVDGRSEPLGATFWLLAALVLAGELLPMEVPRGESFDRVTLSGAFAFALLLLAGPLPATAAYVLASVVADGADRIAPAKLVFNAGQYALSVFAAFAVLAAFGVSIPVEPLAAALPEIAVAGFVFFAVNHVLAGVGAAILLRRPLWRYLREDLGFQIATSG